MKWAFHLPANASRKYREGLEYSSAPKQSGLNGVTRIPSASWSVLAKRLAPLICGPYFREYASFRKNSLSKQGTLKGVGDLVFSCPVVTGTFAFPCMISEVRLAPSGSHSSS